MCAVHACRLPLPCSLPPQITRGSFHSLTRLPDPNFYTSRKTWPQDPVFQEVCSPRARPDPRGLSNWRCRRCLRLPGLKAHTWKAGAGCTEVK